MPLLASSLYSFGLYCGYLMCGGAWLLIVSYVSAAMCSGACSLSSLTAFDCGTVCWSAALMGIRWRFQVDTLEVSGSFGSGPLSVIPFCHRIPITHGATSTTPSTREVAYERQEIDNAATVSRGTLRPVIYLGREWLASVTSYPPMCGQTWHPATSIQYRVVTETVLRALRDLRAPWWPGMPSLVSCVTHPPARDASRLYILLGSRSLRFFRCFA